MIPCMMTSRPADSQPTEPDEIVTEQDSSQGDIKDHGKDPNISVGGSIVYQSPAEENETWKAGSKEQDFLIANPAGNTDDLAAHIYVDLNKDGEFTKDECVYNPIEYDEDGNVTSYGKFIAPGKEIEHITILQEIPAGTYDASLQFTAVDIDTKTLDNPMNFDFELKVE